MRPTAGSPSGGWVGPAVLNLSVICALIGVVLLIRPYIPEIDLTGTPSFEARPGLQGDPALNDEGNVDFPSSLRSNLPLIKEAGAGWVRLTFRLGSHYTDWTTKDSRGMSAADYYDVLVREAREVHGLKVLGVISRESWPGTQGEWLANNAEFAGGTGDNAYLQAFSKRAVAVLVERFRGRVDEWEIWSAPNGFTTGDGGEPRGASFIFPSNFAWLLRHAYEDTRHVPGARIVSGGILITDLGTRPKQGGPARLLRSQSAGQYLAETYRLGRRLAGWETLRERSGRYPLDDIGVQLFVDQATTTTASKIRSSVEEARDAYVAFEGPKSPKRIVVTEMGWSTTMVDQRVQAENLQVAYSTLKALPYVRNAFWYLIQDLGSTEDQFGLQTAGARANQYRGVPKLSLDAYREAAVYSPGFEVLGVRLGAQTKLSFVGGSGSGSAEARRE